MTTPQQSPNNPTRKLPPNSQSLFGGFDARESFSKGNGARQNLFELSNARDYNHVPVNWGTDPNDNATFDIPSFLEFSWNTNYEKVTITGDTKKEYQSSLSENMGLGGSIDRFGLEVNVSFSESDYSETYNKYASIYEKQQVYSLRLATNDPEILRENLTDHAREMLDTKSPEDIIEILGTHFMSEAIFGGLKR